MARSCGDATGGGAKDPPLHAEVVVLEGQSDRGAPGPGNSNSTGSVWLFTPGGESAYGLLSQLTVSLTGFGTSLAPIEDIDGDGFPDLAVGTLGRMCVVRFGANGSVRAQRNFLPGVTCEGFGASLCALDDLDGDGRRELACGAPLTRVDAPGGQTRALAGAAVIVSLNADGTLRSSFLISELQGGFTGFLDREDRFGTAVTWLGDLDGDGFGELAVLDRLLDRAGIAKVDVQGQKLDIHALRTTCASQMARRGVPLAITQRWLGHSDPKLTAQHYTDLGVEDLRAAVEAHPVTEPERAKEAQ